MVCPKASPQVEALEYTAIRWDWSSSLHLDAPTESYFYSLQTNNLGYNSLQSRK